MVKFKSFLENFDNRKILPSIKAPLPVEPGAYPGAAFSKPQGMIRRIKSL